MVVSLINMNVVHKMYCTNHLQIFMRNWDKLIPHFLAGTRLSVFPEAKNIICLVTFGMTLVIIGFSS